MTFHEQSWILCNSLNFNWLGCIPLQSLTYSHIFLATENSSTQEPSFAIYIHLPSTSSVSVQYQLVPQLIKFTSLHFRGTDRWANGSPTPRGIARLSTSLHGSLRSQQREPAPIPKGKRFQSQIVTAVDCRKGVLAKGRRNQ